MEDNTDDVILLVILMVAFALIVGLYKDSDDVELAVETVQEDNLFNKWRRIY